MLQGPDTLIGNEWINYAETYYKFSVDEDGIYRIPYTALIASGIPAGTRGIDFKLFSLGQQVAVFVSTDDVFTTDDYIEFHGFKNRGELDRYLYRNPDDNMLNPMYSMYSDRRPYYLTIDPGIAPVRVTSLANDLSNPPSAEPYYLHREIIDFNDTSHDPYFLISGGGAISYSSYMHGEGFGKFAQTNSSTQINSSQRAFGSTANLHLRLASTNYGDHQFTISWNGEPIDTLDAFDIHIRDTIYSIPLTSVLDNNVLTITNNNSSSRHALVSIALTYPRLNNLNGETESIVTLAPKSGQQYYQFDDFSTDELNPVIYSTDGLSRMEAEYISGHQFHFLWPEVENETTLRIANQSNSISVISSLNKMSFTDFSGDNTEYIVITHPDLMASGTESEYIQYRLSDAGGNYKAKAYSILDLYDQFGYGIEKHPQAIRNFVEFFNRHWSSAEMVFIIGRGIEYNKSRIENGTWESSYFVPTFGRPGSDNLLAATLWDLVPRYPIGRLAVVDPAAIQTYLNKVKEHGTAMTGDQTLEEKGWIKNVLHIGGGKNSSEQNSFKEVLNSLGKDISTSDFGANVSFFHKESTEVIGESTSKQIERLLREGSTIINYLGHSSTSTFEFTINDPAEWNNKGRYPVFSAMGCSAGQIHGTSFGLSDRYVQIPDEGAIAFISGSGSQFASALISWARPWYDYFGNVAYGSTLGESILFGLKGVSNFVNPELLVINSYRFLLEQQTFQGDPALTLHPFPGPDYLIDPNSVVIAPEILNTKLDSFDLIFSIQNIGRNLHQTIGYSIKLRTPAGEELALKNDTIRCNGFTTIVSVRLPLMPGLDAGSYRLLIEVDADKAIEELPQPMAESNNTLKDNVGIEGIQIVLLNDLVNSVYPPDFAIVKEAPELVASGSNAFLTGQDFVFELDTTPLFNSPSLVRQQFNDHASTLKWKPDVQYIDNQEYYWRVSLDSISPAQGFLWSKRSFLYKTGSPPGWNQSHFYQHTDNQLTGLVTDSLHLTLDFDNTVTNFRILNRYQDPTTGGIPFGFVDNVYYTEFFSKFTNNDVNVFVVAINPVTGTFMRNPNPGLYGSFNNLSYDIRCFPYRTDLPESRQDLIHFVQDIIPSGYYVFFYTYQRPGRGDYFPEQWAADEENFEHSIFSLIESEYPSSAIRSLATTGSKPYIGFFQKGIGGIEEIFAVDTADVISMSYDIKSSLEKGTMISTLVGPASQWYSMHLDYTLPLIDTAGLNIISVWALSANFADTLWISRNLTAQDTIIDDIDATAFPYIQFAMHTQDTVNYVPAKLKYWRVLYEGYPELVIQHDLGYTFIDDTLHQGETMYLNTSVENVSPYDVDSLPVSLRIINENNVSEQLNALIQDVKGHSGALVEFEKNTGSLQGDYQVLMEVNPGRDIIELNYANNIGILPMHILADKANPILDVTFDGYHIKDGDLVASKPLIMIQLKDENQYLRLDDTSSFIIYLEYPSSFESRRLYFTDADVHFVTSPSTGPNVALVEFTPELLENGIYRLHANAKDASGNIAGDNDYSVSFEVINEPSISYIYNYPNPFSSSTRFIYTLTGPGAPAFYKIEILSISGILVREITQEDLGFLAPGNHRTEYEWDGKDNNGNEISAGLYLYRLVARDEDNNEYKRFTPYGNSDYTNDGWGKLVLVR